MTQMKETEKFLNLKTYSYNLPEELIANEPATPRDSSKLIVCSGDKFSHEKFNDLPKHLKKGDVLVLNNTRVIPARLFGTKIETGAKIEILLLKRKSLTNWEIIAKPAKRLKIGNTVKFAENFSCVVVSKFENGNIEVSFNWGESSFETELNKVGEMPLPHYIKGELKDRERYQTVFSKHEGSAAAPTAGLHFTPQLIEKIQSMGVIIVEVLLHVGLGTFRPVKEENILDHEMHSEWIELSSENAEIINTAKKENRRVIAVGTTSVRVLESAAIAEGKVEACKKNTNIFIYPSCDFKIVDGLITNFHLPESTLLMLVCAFNGIKETLKIYQEAIEKKYRFFSFGDACFFVKGEI